MKNIEVKFLNIEQFYYLNKKEYNHDDYSIPNSTDVAYELFEELKIYFKCKTEEPKRKNQLSKLTK